MIYLTKGQVLKDNTSMVVYDHTGYYNDGDSVICASVVDPEEPVCRYEAKFVAFGGIVYSISDPDELLEQVKKIDPNTLFGKDSKQVAVDNIVKKIVPQKSTDLTAVDEPVDDTIVDTETPTTNATSTPSTTTSTTTPSTDTSTSTPDFNFGNSNGTSTPTTTPDFDFSTSSTTPTSTPDFNFGTSTSTANTTPTTTPPDVLLNSTTTLDVPIVASSTPAITPVSDPVTPTTTDQIVAMVTKAVKKRILK